MLRQPLFQKLAMNPLTRALHFPYVILTALSPLKRLQTKTVQLFCSWVSPFFRAFTLTPSRSLVNATAPCHYSTGLHQLILRYTSALAHSDKCRFYAAYLLSR